MKDPDWHSLAYVSLIVAGGTLWLVNWWAGRPLFIDESNLARNLFDRSFTGLFSPLAHEQYAPPLYLVATKLFGELFGYGERALRFPALLGGLLAVVGLWLAGRRLRLGPWGMLPLALLFVNPTVLRFVGEVKPYSLDLGIAALLLAVALKSRSPDWKWALIGITVIWFSLPSVFVLAAVGLYGLLRGNREERIRWGGIITVWLVSFAGLYLQVLRPSIGSNYLVNFHTPYFFPLPNGEGFDFARAGNLLLAQLWLTFGFTAFAMVLGAAATLASLNYVRKGRLFLCLAPLVIVFLVSTTGYYSLITRLMLFTLPGCWLLVALTSSRLAERWEGRAGAYGILLVVPWLIVIGGTNVARHYFSPLVFSDARKLVTEIEPGYRPLPQRSSLPAYDYYQRIHPRTRTGAASVTVPQKLTDQPQDGNYAVLYDVVMQPSSLVRMQQDSAWAVTRGASEVRVEELVYARVLYVKF